MGSSSEVADPGGCASLCGRAVQATGPLQVAILSDVPDTLLRDVPPRYNAAPSQELWVIRQNHDTGERSLDLLRSFAADADLLEPVPGAAPASGAGRTRREGWSQRAL